MTALDAPVLVLGASGRIGRLLRHVWPDRQEVVWHSRRPQDGFESCDVLSQSDRLIRLAKRSAAILCLAGVTDRQHKHHGDCYSNNSRIAQAVIIAAQKAGCSRVFLCSSAAVYGRPSGPCVEGSWGKRVSHYGQAKRDMEIAASALGAATGVTVCSLRIGNLAGADAILGGWTPGFELDAFDDGCTPTRSYLSARVLADVVVALSRVESIPPALNVAQPGLVAMGDLLDAAGLNWTKRPATKSTIKEVELSVQLLEKTLQRQIPTARAEILVQEWRDIAELDCTTS